MSTSALEGPSATRSEDRVSFGEKLAFGLGYLPVFYGMQGVGSFTIPVYQMTLRLDPVLVGIALSLPRLLDAIIDPIMGRISDNTTSRWGRRRPYIVCGALLQSLLFGIIWMVPFTWSSAATAGYLIATLMLFYVGYTMYVVPYNSLGYEMTPDYTERTNVWAFATFFNKLGELGYSWVFPLTNLAIFGTVTHGVHTVGWLVAALVFGGFGLFPGLFVKERHFKKTVSQEKVRIWPALKASTSSRAFMLLISLTVLQIAAGMFCSNLDHYLIVYYMFAGNIAEGSFWKGMLSSSYAILGILWIYPVTWIARRYGKHVSLGVTFVLTLFGAAGKWLLYTPGHPWKILFDCLLCGPIWVAIYTLTPSMLADVCDEDELRHGVRRVGTFGALFSWVQQTGYSLASLGTMLTLKFTGFDAAAPGGIQSAHTLTAMRLWLTIPTAIWALAALAILSFYPITKQRAYNIRDELEKRRGKI